MHCGEQVTDLQNFLTSINEFSFQEKYFKWQAYLNALKQANSQYYRVILQKFIEFYPFNHTYWIQLCDQALKVPKGKTNAVKLYQVALNKNPRSIELWKKYLSWLQKQLTKSDPNYLKKQLQKASRVIGNHYRASFIFEALFQLETNPIKRYQVMKRALVSPLEEIDRIYDTFVTFIDSGELNSEDCEILVGEEGMEITTKKQDQLYAAQIRDLLKAAMRKYYEPTKQHVSMRRLYEQKIINQQYQPYQDSIENWRNYIAFIKHSGNSQFLIPIYEQALITQCDNEVLWEDYFLILQNENHYSQILYLLRSHTTFFQSLSKQITYYWLQIEQRENPSQARQLYLQLQTNQYHLETFMKHIQLQVRSKQFNNAKIIYETILTVFTTNVNIISYVVIEYAEFSLKYFRQIQFSKKVLKTYFQSYPYNQYMFIKYIQFYLKHIQYKQGSKDGKQIYDQFIYIIVIGLEKAINNQPQQYQILNKIIRKYMRTYITSIYLVKSAQRKIKEMEIKHQRNHSKAQLKRMLEIQNYNGKISEPNKQRKTQKQLL